jgi:hypothetical protein
MAVALHNHQGCWVQCPQLCRAGTCKRLTI